jgi:hypothetical protein
VDHAHAEFYQIGQILVNDAKLKEVIVHETVGTQVIIIRCSVVGVLGKWLVLSGAKSHIPITGLLGTWPGFGIENALDLIR